MKHTIKPGECIASVAFAYGFFPDTLWNLPENEELRKLRGNANVLLEGDVVEVPEKRARVETCATDTRHTFHRKGVPEKLNLELRADGSVRPDVDYVFEVDGAKRKGRTREGRVEEWIPPGAQRATLIISDAERYDLAVGHVDPVTTKKGVRDRLVSLGYLAAIDASSEDDQPAMKAALLELQRTHDLEASSVLDDATRRALVAEYGA